MAIVAARHRQQIKAKLILLVKYTLSLIYSKLTD